MGSSALNISYTSSHCIQLNACFSLLLNCKQLAKTSSRPDRRTVTFCKLYMTVEAGERLTAKNIEIILFRLSCGALSPLTELTCLTFGLCALFSHFHGLVALHAFHSFRFCCGIVFCSVLFDFVCTFLLCYVSYFPWMVLTCYWKVRGKSNEPESWGKPTDLWYTFARQEFINFNFLYVLFVFCVVFNGVVGWWKCAFVGFKCRKVGNCNTKHCVEWNWNEFKLQMVGEVERKTKIEGSLYLGFMNIDLWLVWDWNVNIYRTICLVSCVIVVSRASCNFNNDVTTSF